MHDTITFAIIDIDHFKKVNDTYGHQVGDEVLKRLSASLMAAVRKNDVLARFGGEEFVLCFPDVGNQDGVQILERLQNRLHTDLTHTDPPLPPCTLSIGVATGKPQIGDKIDTYLKLSDEALYYCKNNGRNCTAQLKVEIPGIIQRVWPKEALHEES